MVRKNTFLRNCHLEYKQYSLVTARVDTFKKKFNLFKSYLSYALGFGNSSISNCRVLTSLLTQSVSSIYTGDENVTLATKNINGVRIRVYTPYPKQQNKIRPITVYFHGGGFVLGDLGKFLINYNHI
jgi:acetyl esterase/lipase